MGYLFGVIDCQARNRGVCADGEERDSILLAFAARHQKGGSSLPRYQLKRQFAAKDAQVQKKLS
jgi:hypothetical protein